MTVEETLLPVFQRCRKEGLGLYVFYRSCVVDNGSPDPVSEGPDLSGTPSSPLLLPTQNPPFVLSLSSVSQNRESFVERTKSPTVAHRVYLYTRCTKRL